MFSATGEPDVLAFYDLMTWVNVCDICFSLQTFSTVFEFSRTHLSMQLHTIKSEAISRKEVALACLGLKHRQ